MINLICLFKHDYHNIKDLSGGFQKVGCARCKKEWLVGATNKIFVPWNNNIEEFSTEVDPMLVGV